MVALTNVENRRWGTRFDIRLLTEIGRECSKEADPEVLLHGFRGHGVCPHSMAEGLSVAGTCCGCTLRWGCANETSRGRTSNARKWQYGSTNK